MIKKACLLMVVPVALYWMPLFALSEDDSKALARCAMAQNGLARLECFDDFTKKHGVIPDASITTESDWVVRVDVSPVDDSKTVIVAVRSNSEIVVGYGRVMPKLILRCAEKATSVYIDWDKFLGSDSSSVLVRFDKEKAYSEYWSISTDHKATFHREPKLFINKVFGKSKMIARTTPFGESPILAEFNVSGLEDAVKPLREACSW